MPTIEEIQFPADISYGARGGPEFSTDIVELFSAKEQRNINWSQARARYSVSHGVKTPAQLDELIAFFRARQGRAIGFRFKDWTDYQAAGQNLGTGNGTVTQFQLVKKYTSGSVTVTRTISKPVNNGTLKIYLNAVLQGSGYSVNYTTGIVTFTVAPGAGVVVTADFEFDVPVRFDIDHLDPSIDDFGTRSWEGITLVELK
jgi:uncharacterized protein (TIGR02217 family)